MRNYFKLTSIIFLLIVFIGCAAQKPLLKPTTSGWPEGTFENTTIVDVKSKLIEGSAVKGYMVIGDTSNSVLCAKTLEGGNSLLARMAIGNNYSTEPQNKVRFVVFQKGKDVRVTVQQWIETQMAFGQINTMEIKSNEANNRVQKFLFSLGAK